MGEQGVPPKEHQYQPGQSGNPAGRPKGAKSLTTLINEALNKEITAVNPVTNRLEKMKLREIVALRWVGKAALKGEDPAIKDIIDRLDGKPIQTVQSMGSIEVKLTMPEGMDDVKP